MKTDQIKYIVLGMCLALFFVILGIQLDVVGDLLKHEKLANQTMR